MKYYVLLKVAPLATQDEVHAGYLKVAVENHPDKGGDAALFKAITFAHSVLKDAKKRKKYDAELKLLKKWVVCKTCKGAGTKVQASSFIKAVLRVPCKTCGGTGV